MCKKHSYSSRESARKGAWELAKSIFALIRPYECPDCGYWHLTSQHVTNPAVCIFVGDYMFYIQISKNCIKAKVRTIYAVIGDEVFKDTSDFETPFIWGFDWFEKHLSPEYFNAFNEVASPLFEQLKEAKHKPS